MNRPRTLVLLALLPLAGCAGTPQCLPVSGEISEAMTSPVSASGTASGDLDGAISIRIDTMWAGEAGSQHFRARHTLVTSTRDSLFTTDEGTMTPVSETIFSIRNTLAAAGGTGAFRSARGRIETDGHVDFTTGAVALRYRGRLCGLARPE